MSGCCKIQGVLFMALFTLTAIFVVPCADAGTYYVSSSGSASWPNCTSQSNPCSPATALANAAAGDLVNFLPGRYNAGSVPNDYTPAWNPAHSGSAGNYITFKAEPGTVTVSCEGALTGPCIGTYGRNYIIWDGFIVEMYGRDKGMQIRNGTGSIIQNCEIIANAACSTSNPCNASSNHEGIRVDTTHYAIARNNKIHGVQGAANSVGIKLYVTDNFLAEHNEVYDCAGGLYSKHANTGNNVFRYNLVHNIKLFALGAGSDTSGPTYFYQNVVHTPVSGSFAIQVAYNPTAKNVYVYNNTFDVGSSGAWAVYCGTSHTGTEVFNNIIYASSPAGATGWVYGNLPSYQDYNIVYPYAKFSNGSTYASLSSWQAATGFDDNSRVVDPLFVNRAEHDYRLQSGSPARSGGRGGSYSTVMGAYITGNEIIGITSTTSPVTKKPNPPVSLIAR